MMKLSKISAVVVCVLWFLMVHTCHARDVQESASQDYGPTDPQDPASKEYYPNESQDYDQPDDTQDTKSEDTPQDPPPTKPHDSKSDDTPPDPPPTKPHDSTPQEWVDAHNAIRKPEGVVLMHWNESLAQYAEKYVKKIAPNCKTDHSGGPYGECIFQGDGAATAKEIVDYWASEKQYYDVKSKKCADDQDCGHYLQVVNPNSPSLGCAKAKCANDVFYWIDVCSYTW